MSNSLTAFFCVLLLAVNLHYRSFIKGSTLALYDFTICKQSNFRLAPPIDAKLVAHAGGAVRGLTYTNSREALDESYAKGYRVFELDFNWTTDGRLVLVHDWAQTSSQFGMPPHVFTYYEYIESMRRDGLHQLTFEQLQEWMLNHSDALIVTDTKDSNARLLDYLGKYGRNIRLHLIVQIYRLPEFDAARQLGPRAVWLTVYKSSYPAWALSRIHGVDAFVIPAGAYARYYRPQLMARVHFYEASIPAESVSETSKQHPGIYGFFVD